MDKTKESYICDGCGSEMLERSAYPSRHKLVLSSRDFNVNDSNIEFSVICRPVLDRQHHFCGFSCLQKWLHETTKSEAPRKQGD